MKVSINRLAKPNKQPEYRVEVSATKFNTSAEITLPTRKFAEEVQRFVTDVCEVYEKELFSLNEDYERLRKALNEERQKNA